MIALDTEFDQPIGTDMIRQISAAAGAITGLDTTAAMIAAGGIERLTRCRRGSEMTKRSEDDESMSVTSAVAKVHIDQGCAVRILIWTEALSIEIGMTSERVTL